MKMPPDTDPQTEEPHGDCVGVIAHVMRGRAENGAFLFLLRSGGRFADQWWPLAGTCEPGEGPLDTLLREIPEEIGLVPEAIYGPEIRLPHPEGPGHLQIFVALLRDDAEVTLNYEHSEFRWLSVSETIELVPDSMESHVRELSEVYLAAEPPAERLIWARP